MKTTLAARLLVFASFCALANRYQPEHSSEEPAADSPTLRSSISASEAAKLFDELQGNSLYRMPNAEVHCLKRAYLMGHDLEVRDPGVLSRLLEIDCRGTGFGVVDPRTRSYHDYVNHWATVISVQSALGRKTDQVFDTQFQLGPVPLDRYLKQLIPARPKLRLINAEGWDQKRRLKAFESAMKHGDAVCFYSLNDRRNPPEPSVPTSWLPYRLESYRQEIEETNEIHLQSASYKAALKLPTVTSSELEKVRKTERTKALRSQLRVFEYEAARRKSRPLPKLTPLERTRAEGLEPMTEAYFQATLRNIRNELEALGTVQL